MRSVSQILLVRVLTLYIALTALLLITMATLDYVESRKSINKELKMLEITFSQSIAYALWQMADEQLDAAVGGILNMRNVSRVIIYNEYGKVVRDLKPQNQIKSWLNFIPKEEFKYKDKLSYENTNLGWLEVHSNSEIIFARMQNQLLYSIVAELLKAFALILLVKLFFDRILTQPLFKVAETAATIDPRHTVPYHLPVKNEGAMDELDIISNAINRLATDVSKTVNELDTLNKDLENQVEQRTTLLQETLADVERQHDKLEQEVGLRKVREAELEKVNFNLADSLAQLKVAQEGLLQSEKMAALGGLVAGVAHEINTPVGLGLTGASHFQYKVSQIETLFKAGELEETAFQTFVDESKELARAIVVSLEKAAELVRSFKLLAVDQGHDGVRSFNVKDYINDILLTHHPVLRKAHVETTLECDGAIVVESFPGAWSQVLSNLVNNSVIHGFTSEIIDPKINIKAVVVGENIELDYIDNGQGMSKDNARKIYDPFFTTNRQQGSSGIGMNIVYNLITQKLKGEIKFDTAPGKGVHFHFVIPRNAASDENKGENEDGSI